MTANWCDLQSANMTVYPSQWHYCELLLHTIRPDNYNNQINCFVGLFVELSARSSGAEEEKQTSVTCFRGKENVSLAENERLGN